MKPMRVYVDASVFGGCFDQEFSETSQLFFAAVFEGTIVALISDTLVAELVGAPESVRQLLNRVRRTNCELLDYTDETADLQRAYLRAEIVSARYGGDALHVAYATLARADVLVSWNFRHLVNPLRERAFNGVNVANGYGFVSIVTPTEVVKMLEVSDEPEEG